MKKIKLTQDKYTIVDDADFEWLNQWKWCYHKIGYVFKKLWKRNRALYMHRLIMNTPKGMETDHINGDKLDNRRSNLRVCTRSQNEANKGLRIDNTSGYKGVYWNRKNKKWVANIGFNYKNIYLGEFNDRFHAMKAYNAKAKELFGEFARLNSI